MSAVTWFLIFGQADFFPAMAALRDEVSCFHAGTPRCLLDRLGSAGHPPISPDRLTSPVLFACLDDIWGGDSLFDAVASTASHDTAKVELRRLNIRRQSIAQNLRSATKRF